ncbi:MAG: hypothetical protein IT431_06035 [Phycisphaerales bacterium]|nr:hypothetical protein [Phycisphaerales bacterium]
MIATSPTPRPDPGPPDFLGLPPELRAFERFLHWRYEWRDGDWAKVPFDPRSGARIDPTNPENLVSYLLAADLYTRHAGACAGIGFSFDADEGICGIDLDDCVDEQGSVSPEAQRLLRNFDSYAEYSPSGTGVKIFVRGRKPEWARCTSTALDGIGKIEVYDQKRYFTLTGRVVPGCVQLISERQEQLEALCARLWRQREDRPGVIARIGGAGFNGDDEAMLQKARSATNGEKFAALFDRGDTSGHGGDESAADAALACHLAFWCGPDRDRIERLFSLSARGQREKWQEREDYRRMTIDFAIENATDHYGDDHARARPAPRRADSGMPEITLDTDEHRVIEETVAALTRDPELYSRGGRIAEVIRTDADGAGVVIAPLQTPRLREVITRNATLLRITNKGETPCHPTGWLVKGVESRGCWHGLRRLRLVSEAPVLRPDGTIWQARGFDPVTGVLYMPGCEFPEIPARPTHGDACESCDRLLDLVCDFPFASTAHAAAHLSAVLTAVARHAFTGPSPLFLVDANVRGAGKTLLGSIVAIIATGRVPPMSSYVHDSMECRKQITTLAMEGARVVLLDNLGGVIGNDALDRALTSDWWQDRVLGTNSSFSGPMLAVWIATGNNVTVKADTTRRTVYIRLDSPLENPEDRAGFRHRDLIGHVLANRPRLLADAITIVAAYLQAGRPDMELRPYGSFNGWSDVVRSAVRWLGLPDPCDTRELLEVAADTEKDALGRLIAAWHARAPDGQGVGIAELIRQLYPTDGGWPADEAAIALRDAIEALVASTPGKVPTARQLGNKLRTMKRRVIDGKMLDTDTQKTSKGQIWRVVEVNPRGTKE